jgi:hypothetical protein
MRGQKQTAGVDETGVSGHEWSIVRRGELVLGRGERIYGYKKNAVEAWTSVCRGKNSVCRGKNKNTARR